MCVLQYYIGRDRKVLELPVGRHTLAIMTNLKPYAAGG